MLSLGKCYYAKNFLLKFRKEEKGKEALALFIGKNTVGKGYHPKKRKKKNVLFSYKKEKLSDIVLS